MDKKLKAKWVKALRSGKYKQCTQYLAKDGGYCCLGVLHKVVTKTEPPALWDSNRPKQLEFLDKPVSGMRLERVLAKMNDGGQSFEQLADYIEKNL